MLLEEHWPLSEFWTMPSNCPLDFADEMCKFYKYSQYVNYSKIDEFLSDLWHIVF